MPEHLALYLWLVRSCWDLTQLPLSPAAHAVLRCRFVSAAQRNGVGCATVQAAWVASTVRIPFAQRADAEKVKSRRTLPWHVTGLAVEGVPSKQAKRVLQATPRAAIPSVIMPRLLLPRATAL